MKYIRNKMKDWRYMQNREVTSIIFGLVGLVVFPIGAIVVFISPNNFAWYQKWFMVFAVIVNYFKTKSDIDTYSKYAEIRKNKKNTKIN